jgi:hypothetical protein
MAFSTVPVRVDQTTPSLPKPSCSKSNRPYNFKYCSTRSLGGREDSIVDHAADSYSADFQGKLVIGSVSFPLARLDTQELGLATPVDLPPTDAEIVLVIDGREHRSAVRLDDGSCATSREVTYRRL